MKRPPRLLDQAFNIVELPCREKILLIHMARYANSSTVCYASQARLALDTGMSDRSVRRALKELRDLKLIIRLGGNSRRTDAYCIRPDNWTGQTGHRHRTSSPFSGGQFDRQNHKLNQNLNQSSSSARQRTHNRPLSSTVDDILNRLQQGIESATTGGSGDTEEV
jgi:DNA-binding transcriptional regulator GbsR (MarR family)